MADVAEVLDQVKGIGQDVRKEIEGYKTDLQKTLDQVKGQVSEQGKVSEDLAAQYKGLESKISEVGEKYGKEIEQLAVKLNRPEFQTTQRVESMASMIKSALEKLTEQGLGRSGKFNGNIDLKSGQSALYTKAVGDMGNANLSGYASRDIRSNVVYDPANPDRLRHIIPVSTLSAPILEYPKETGGEGGVAFQTEGSAKSQQDFDFQMVSETPKTIAVFTRLTKQSVADIGWLSSHVARRLTDKWFDFEDNQIINGDGIGNNFKGLLNQGSAYVPTAGTSPIKVDRIVNAIAQLKATYYRPTGILISPLDFGSILLHKTTGGEYTHPGLIYGADNIWRLYGVPIIENGACPTGTVIVGDFNQAELAIREGLSFGAYYEDGSNVTTNKVTYLLEGRETLAVYDGKAFRIIAVDADYAS